MTHSPADVVRHVLIGLGLGTASGAWPVFVDSEPNAPDNCVTVYDTQGLDQGRDMNSGEMLGPVGFQVRIRAADHQTGWAKADAIAEMMAKSVYQRQVAISGRVYVVHAISRVGNVIRLGKEQNGNRSLFTVNAVTNVRQLS